MVLIFVFACATYFAVLLSSFKLFRWAGLLVIYLAYYLVLEAIDLRFLGISVFGISEFLSLYCQLQLNCAFWPLVSYNILHVFAEPFGSLRLRDKRREYNLYWNFLDQMVPGRLLLLIVTTLHYASGNLVNLFWIFCYCPYQGQSQD